MPMGMNGEIELGETGEEIREYLEKSENPTYREFKEEYGGLKAVGLTQGPTAVVREDNQEIRVGEPDLLGIGEPLEQYEEAQEPSKLKAGVALTSLAAGGASLTQLFRTGNPNWLTAGALSLYAGKDEIEDTLSDLNGYRRWKKLRQQTIDDIESNYEGIEEYEIVFDPDMDVPGVGIDMEEIIGTMELDQDLESGQAFQ